MEKLRIAFDAKRYVENRTGLGNYSRWLINGLENNGVETWLCHSSAPDNSHRWITPQSPLHKQFPSFWRSRGISNQISSKGVDLYHGLSNAIPFGIHRSGVKTVVTIHDLIQKRYPENYKAIDRTIYNRKINYAQAHADLVICPSQQTKRDLSRYFGTPEGKIEVIPIGFELAKTGDKQQEAKHLLCVSSFTRRKNLIRLAKAYEQSSIEMPLIIAGHPGEDLARMRRLAAQIKGLTLVVGPTDAQLDELYNTALFCVYPSEFEGFGMPVIESFQHNKTLALSKRSSLPEVGGEAAHYFDPGDPSSISRAISELYHSQKLRTALEQRIPEQLAKFESQHCIEAYLSIYNKILSIDNQQLSIAP